MSWIPKSIPGSSVDRSRATIQSLGRGSKEHSSLECDKAEKLLNKIMSYGWREMEMEKAL